MRNKPAIRYQPAAGSRIVTILQAACCKLQARKAAEGGFTLIEVLVMTTVVTIGVLATLVTADLTIRASDTNEKRVVATNLAREGVELVRAIRDTNWATYARQQQAGVPVGLRVAWDCFGPPGTEDANPPACTGNLSSNVAPVNYIAYPWIGNGKPSLEVFNGAGAGTTTSDVYLICPATDIPIYTPRAPKQKPCVGGATPYYRRVTIKQGKNVGSGKYSLKVTSSVNWPGHEKSSDITIETYLTDWRQF